MDLILSTGEKLTPEEFGKRYAAEMRRVGAELAEQTGEEDLDPPRPEDLEHLAKAEEQADLFAPKKPKPAPVGQASMFGAPPAPPTRPEMLQPHQRRTRSNQYYVGPRGGKWADPEHTIPWSGEGGAIAGQQTIQAPGAQDVTQLQHENPVVKDIIDRQTKAAQGYVKAAQEAREAGDKKAEAGAWAQAEKAARNVAAALEHLGDPRSVREATDWIHNADSLARKKQDAFDAAEGPKESYYEFRERMKEARQRTKEHSIAAREARKSDAYGALEDYIRKSPLDKYGKMPYHHVGGEPMGHNDDMAKGGPYIGPRGGKWADPEHTISYQEPGKRLGKVAFKKEMDRRRADGCVVKGPKTFQYKEIIKDAGGIWDSWEKQWLVPSREIADKLTAYMGRGGSLTPKAALPPAKPEIRAVAGEAGSLQTAQEAHVRQGGQPVTSAEFDQFWVSLKEAVSGIPRSSRWEFLDLLGLTDVVDNIASSTPDKWKLTASGERELRDLSKVELAVLLDAVRSITAKEQRAESGRELARTKQRQAATQRELADLDVGKLRVSRGQGYGGRDYRVGQVLSHPEHGLVAVVKSGKRYISDDGLSFGVGDEEGYIFWAHVRRATKEESQAYLDKKAQKELGRMKVAQLSDLGTEIRKRGEYPKGSFDLEGERLFDTQNIYGGGSWFVIEPDGETVWFVQNNGMDGDSWGHNNVRTGGAGAVGFRLKDAELAKKLKKLADELDGRNRPAGGWQPPE